MYELVQGWSNVMSLMQSSKWQDKVEAFTLLEAFIKVQTQIHSVYGYII